MIITVALDGSKERNLSFASGDDVSISLVVYEHDGDTTPITATDFMWKTGAGGYAPVGQTFSFPCVNRTPYSISALVNGARTTLVYGIIEAPFGCRACWTCCDCIWPGPIFTAMATNVVLSDLDGLLVATNVQDAIKELAEKLHGSGLDYIQLE